MPGMKMERSTAGMAGMDMAHMPAALGTYAMNRESSGTSWQPDASPHQGLDIMAGNWSVMFHGMLNGVYDSQGGPRGGDKAFVSGMVMGMASRDVGQRGRVQFRAMLSPDPLMGGAGYPLLLATGETANGRTPLVDRQHPHDLFSELSVSYSHKLSDRTSVFLYAGLPGEPAFGPPAFMHRLSIMDSPEAPISHHWVDSTHITEGVITGGFVYGDVKLEVSGFKGREPDQHRYDIETPKLDSIAIRASYNPTHRLALQASWARQISPEQLAPEINERRWSVSGIYTVPIGKEGFWSTTAIWAQRRAFGVEQRGPTLDAWVLESAVHPDPRWTIYGRYERVDNDELLSVPAGKEAPVFTVSKAELGVIRDFEVLPHLKFGIGAQVARNFVGHDLAAAYGGDRWGSMGFVRLKID
ncbi:MAG: hypothetical protein M3N34_09585 [Pseudomonadota bacterium]|nr:hypothetical protein [Pseudomonadota bacterium]